MMDTTMINFYSFFHRSDRIDKLRVLYDWHGWWSTFTFFLSSTHLYDLNNAKYVLIHHEDAQDQIKESEMTCNIYPWMILLLLILENECHLLHQWWWYYLTMKKKVKTVFELMMRVKTEAGVREETRGIRQTAAYFIIY